MLHVLILCRDKPSVRKRARRSLLSRLHRHGTCAGWIQPGTLGSEA